MEKRYSIQEILGAIDDLQGDDDKKDISMETSKKAEIKKADIPLETLRLIEEAEKTIRSKLQSE